MNYVFVYGTLMKDERNHHLINDEDFATMITRARESVK